MEHLRITVSGKVYDVIVEKIDGDEPETSSAPVMRAAVPAAASVSNVPPPFVSRAPAGAGDTTSPLAGLVQAIAVEVGATVNEGDLVVTLEAMKMYTSINAPAGGTIKTIHVKVGEAVDEGQVLFTIG